jgi:hypothetical protein
VNLLTGAARLHLFTEIDKHLERPERDLNESEAQAILGEGRLEELHRQRLAAILEAKEEELEAMSDEESFREDDPRALCRDKIEADLESEEEALEARGAWPSLRACCPRRHAPGVEQEVQRAMGENGSPGECVARFLVPK